MLKIEGKRVYLQEFTEANLEDPRYFGWLRDLDVVNFIGRLEYLLPIRISEIRDYVEKLINSKEDCFFAIYHKLDNEFIGTLRIGHINWRVGVGDIGIMIGEKKYRNQGLSIDAVSTAANYSYTYLCLRKLRGGTSSSNIAMRKCFERVGFLQEGCLRKQLLMSGEFHDHIYYGMFKEEYYSIRTEKNRE